MFYDRESLKLRGIPSLELTTLPSVASRLWQCSCSSPNMLGTQVWATTPGLEHLFWISEYHVRTQKYRVPKTPVPASVNLSLNMTTDCSRVADAILLPYLRPCPSSREFHSFLEKEVEAKSCYLELAGLEFIIDWTGLKLLSIFLTSLTSAVIPGMSRSPSTD